MFPDQAHHVATHDHAIAVIRFRALGAREQLREDRLGHLDAGSRRQGQRSHLNPTAGARHGGPGRHLAKALGTQGP